MEQTSQTQLTPDATGQGLSIRRYFTNPGVHPYDELEWETRDAIIGDPASPAFEQRGVEFPKTWSQNATNIVAQKYFRGQPGSPERETSVKQMVSRVANTITGLGSQGRLLLEQRRRRDLRGTSSPTSCCTRWRRSTRRCGSTWALRSSPQCSACLPVPRARLDAARAWSRSARSSRATMVGTRGLRLRRHHAGAWPSRHNGRKPVWRVALAQRQLHRGHTPITSSRRLIETALDSSLASCRSASASACACTCTPTARRLKLTR